eukprot:2664325-Karenia_brevis.AAC.1
MMRFLRGKYDGRPAAYILRLRLQYWFGENVNDEQVNNAVRNLQMLGKRMPPLPFIAATITICNAWNTAKQFQEAPSNCRLRSETAGDNIRHYCACPAV